MVDKTQKKFVARTRAAILTFEAQVMMLTRRGAHTAENPLLRAQLDAAESMHHDLERQLHRAVGQIRHLRRWQRGGRPRLQRPWIKYSKRRTK